jgi:hypothetical protein
LVAILAERFWGDPRWRLPHQMLFLVVLGGRTATSHIEVHDVRFVAGTTVNEARGCRS